MISIGKRISIVECESMTNSTTKVLFDGQTVGTITQLRMRWDANEVIPIKQCSLMSLEKEYDSFLEDFAMELAQHGFWVEINYIKIGMIVEFYHLKDKIEREEKHAKNSLHRK